MIKASGNSKALILIILSAMIFVMVAVSGCINDRTDGIRVTYNFDIYVVDENGTVIDYPVNIYDIDGLKSNTSLHMSKGFGAGTTINGSSHGSGSMYPVYPEDLLVFGASTNNSSLQSDWDNESFSPGSTGYWTIYDHNYISKHMIDNQTSTFNVTIYVSNKTGMMIKK